MKFKVVKRCHEDLGPIHWLLKSFLPFARKRMGFNKPPTIFFQSDDTNAKKLLGKTAQYDPTTMNVTVYVTGRHPKDVLRSLSHELVHHGQNCRGEFSKVPDTAPGYAQKDNHLRNMEIEAYREGNLCFRDWEDNVKTGKIKMPRPLRESLAKETSQSEKYVVKSGDTLSGIAGDFYGDVHKWPIIYKTNKEIIGRNPDMISAGMTFDIPDVAEFQSMSSEEVNSIYSLSSWYSKTGETMSPTGPATEDEPPLDVDETNLVFPIRKEDRPNRISPYGMRGPITSLAKKYAPDGPSPNKKLYKRYSNPSLHAGIDVAVPENTDILAPVSGKITAVSSNKSSGNFVEMRGDDRRVYSFSHINNATVSRGQKVTRGEVIAKSGNTGPSSGPHVHFSIKERGKRIDPMTLYGTDNIQTLSEWKNEELNRLLLEKFTLGVNKNET